MNFRRLGLEEVNSLRKIRTLAILSGQVAPSALLASKWTLSTKVAAKIALQESIMRVQRALSSVPTVPAESFRVLEVHRAPRALLTHMLKAKQIRNGKLLKFESFS